MHDWKAQHPTTYADWCLDRIATALEKLAAANEPAPVESGEPLPDDFPGRDALHEAGVVYLGSVPRNGEGLTALGIDGRTANRILTWLKGAG